MPTTTPLTDAINALTTYSNTVTGASDTTLSDAVATLAAGYGGGSSLEDSIIDGTIGGTYENSNVTKLQFAIFRGNANLEHLKFPNITSINSQVCMNTAKLITFSAVNATTVGGDAFRSCSKLETLTIPKVNDLIASFARDCPLLATADVDGGILRGSAFANDASLTKVILRHATVPNLVSTAAFDGTPFASGGSGGTFYVPSTLINSYRTTGNWVTILGYAHNSIQAIEGSQYENYYADGTPIQ